MNVAILTALFADRSAYEVVEAPRREPVHAAAGSLAAAYAYAPDLT
jgi:hypothetical protein